MPFLEADPYQILGVKPSASSKEIKSAFRELVKQHHPDAGGDQEMILAINAAWQILKDPEKRIALDLKKTHTNDVMQEAKVRGVRNACASDVAQATQGQAAAEDDALLTWVQQVYEPIDRLLGQVMNPFTRQLQDLSADPYDDALMEDFCSYLEKSQHRLKRVDKIYRSIPTPSSAQGFGLSLYHCL